MKNYHKFLYALILSLILSGCGTNPYKAAREADTVEAYDKFINENPRHDKVGVAKRLREIALKGRQEGESYDKAIKNNTIADYQEFVRQYPDSALKHDAMHRLAELEWGATNNGKNASNNQLRDFVDRFGLMRIAHDSKKLLADREKEAWGKAVASNSPSEYMKFADEFPDSEHYKYARAVAKWDKVKSGGKAVDFDEYIQSYKSCEACAPYVKQAETLFSAAQNKEFSQRWSSIRKKQDITGAMTLYNYRPQFFNDKSRKKQYGDILYAGCLKKSDKNACEEFKRVIWSDDKRQSKVDGKYDDIIWSQIRDNNGTLSYLENSYIRNKKHASRAKKSLRDVIKNASNELLGTKSVFYDSTYAYYCKVDYTSRICLDQSLPVQLVAAIQEIDIYNNEVIVKVVDASVNGSLNVSTDTVGNVQRALYGYVGKRYRRTLDQAGVDSFLSKAAHAVK